ncbi:Ig-like domain-containing protein [Cnuella takakiae]|nr:Ig-like domain-containing protein [Cnuella takakiae]OLY93352.1 hypothetical protein BUE76_16780 [Cnuella takakiae]
MHRPYIPKITPERDAQRVNEHVAIATRNLVLPNGPINKSTVNSASVFLTEMVSGQLVPAQVGCDAEGDTILLVPESPLKLNTTYRFHVTSGVRDVKGFPVKSFYSDFSTGLLASNGLNQVQFCKEKLPDTDGRFSSLVFGPDGKLYALSIEGLIKRFSINPDGSLGAVEDLYGLQQAYGKKTERLAIGLTFDPKATADNLVAYITHSSFVLDNGPDWDGRISRLSGHDLGKVQDLVIHLPRSAKDHLTNSIAFGPDSALYIVQGSTSAMGKGDSTWNMREEHLLSGAVLRLDLKHLGKIPLDARTFDAGGPYNPFSPGAPLTLYATGFRNAYDLVWHTNGSLYVPVNGSSPGGNIPGAVAGVRSAMGKVYKGPEAPALFKVRQNQPDLLMRVEKGGYYGHPNPSRGEFIMNGGNPSDAVDPVEVSGYPVGTKPDPNWRGVAFNFLGHKSPNGIIEYKSNAFGGALKGKMIVARYTPGDLVILEPGSMNKDIVNFTEGNAIIGFSGFVLPLDLTEDPHTGNIYVSDYGTGGIYLLRAVTNFQKGQTSKLLFANRRY